MATKVEERHVEPCRERFSEDGCGAPLRHTNSNRVDAGYHRLAVCCPSNQERRGELLGAVGIIFQESALYKIIFVSLPRKTNTDGYGTRYWREIHQPLHRLRIQEVVRHGDEQGFAHQLPQRPVQRQREGDRGRAVSQW